MIDEKTITISNHGRITIPSKFRKKFGLSDGQQVIMVEDEGSLRIIPILPLEEIRKRSVDSQEMERIYQESQEEELEFEKR